MTAMQLLRKPSALLPLAMSTIALTTVLAFLALHGPAPQSDEGAAAHAWQLLMVAQVPLVAFFSIRWVPGSLAPGLRVLALQVGVAFAALAPVYLLRW